MFGFSGTSDKPTSAARIVYCLKIAEAGSEPSSTIFITWWSLAERWKTGVKMALAAAHFHGFGVARQGPWITFFRISRSWRRTLFSLRSLLSSSRSSVVSPSRSPWSICACLTQLRRALSETPSSRAIWEAGLSGSGADQANGLCFELWCIARCCSRHLWDSLLRTSHIRNSDVSYRPGSSPPLRDSPLSKSHR